MRLTTRAMWMAAAVGVLGWAGTAARAEVDIDAKAKAVAKSLVIVDFTLKNENQSGEDSGQGIVVDKEGIILVSGTMIQETIPKEWISEIKVRLPEKNFASVKATFLGRTRDRAFAYLKTSEPIDAPAFDPGTYGEAKLGEAVFSVGRLGKMGNYEMCIGRSEVRSIVNVRHTYASTGAAGLSRGTSPVFDMNTGAFLGITISDGSGGRAQSIEEDASSAFVPGSDVKPLFTDVPHGPLDLRRAWLAVDGLTGLQEDFRTLKKIEQPAGVSVGSVVAGEAADKAGLQPRDVILTVDGKEFSQSTVPELMAQHFLKLMDGKAPGDKLNLGIWRDGKKMDVTVTLGTSPRLGSEMAHVFTAKVGLLTRDLVFNDAYARKLPQDTKGVMVALVKDNSPAKLGATPLQPGFIITKVDDQAVDNQKQFEEVMKKEEEKKDLKEMVFVVILRSGETQVCRIDMTK